MLGMQPKEKCRNSTSNVIYRNFPFKLMFPHSISSEPTQWKATLIVVLTTGSFVVTWMPYFIVSATTGECPLYSPLAMLGFANSLLNPIIYAWWHNGFRTNFLKQLKRFCCTDNEKSVMISTKG